jgi:hypothetical protein
MHDPQRVTALDDVDARQCAPGAPDRIKGAAAARLELDDPGKIDIDDAFGLLQRFMRGILQGETSQRQRHAAVNAAASHVDQFQRTAAKIADDAVRLVNAGNDAERRQFRFARARQDFDADAADAFSLGDEVGAVAGVATGGGGDGVDAADLHHPAQRPKTPQRGQRLGDGVGRQQARGLNLAPEPAQRLLVEKRDQAPRHRFIDDQTHRIRTDVDDRDAGCAFARPLHRADPL